MVDLLSFRIFNFPVPPKERVAYKDFIQKNLIPYSDNPVRDLMQVMMSTPEYQLN